MAYTNLRDPASESATFGSIVGAVIGTSEGQTQMALAARIGLSTARWGVYGAAFAVG